MLTPLQQHALDQLFPSARPPSFLQTWFGLSPTDLTTGLTALMGHKDALEEHWRTWLEHNPLDATFQFLGGAAVAFYLAERQANPKITSVVDAFYYISTCASVGYADIFAVTSTGRMIASLVMTLGPALTARAWDRPLIDAPISGGYTPATAPVVGAPMPKKITDSTIMLRHWNQRDGLVETPKHFTTLDELYAFCLDASNAELIDRIVITGMDDHGQSRSLTFLFQSATAKSNKGVPP